MGITYSDARFTINGQLLTENPVLGNLEKLCNSCGCWLTYDVHQGKWAVIINREGDSVFSFDDSNIIGAITLSTTGLDSFYNVMKATFVHEDLEGQTDFVQIEVPLVDRYPNESLNTLDLTYDLVSDPVQAQLLGFIELKQARVDKVISFRTDYSKMGIKAGDIIDVTNDVYSFVNQKFRVITTREVDSDDSGINIEILALEYDDSVYDETNLNRYIRTGEDGLIDGSIIPAPRTPDIVKFEESTAPRITATTSLVGGLVDEVEFWITDQVAPTYPIEEERVYWVMTSAFPASTDNVFPLNEDITVEVDDIHNSGNFLIKCRAKNAYGVSDFSDPSGLIWNPVTTIDPNAPTEGTQVQGKVDFYETTASVAYANTKYNTYAGSALGGPVTIHGWANAPGLAYGYPGTGSDYVIMEIEITKTYRFLYITVSSPQCHFDYYSKIAGAVTLVQGDTAHKNIWAYAPTYYELSRFNSPTTTVLQNTSSDWQTQSVTFVVENPAVGVYYVRMAPLVTYDLNQEDHPQIFPFNFVMEPNALGGATTFSIMAF